MKVNVCLSINYEIEEEVSLKKYWSNQHEHVYGCLSEIIIKIMTSVGMI